MVAIPKDYREQWDEEGYIILEDALEGDHLKEIQDAFKKHADAALPSWIEGVRSGRRSAGSFDIPKAMEKEDAFIDLADHPNWFGLIDEFSQRDPLFINGQFRTVPPNPISYVGWHPDIPYDGPIHPKMQIYLEDVGPGEGGFAFIPGSHRREKGPYFRPQRLETMPGHREFTGRAGTAILFNGYGWHTSTINRTGHPRRSVILIYEKWNENRHDPERHRGIAERLTPERKRLFGVTR